METMSLILPDIQSHWKFISPILTIRDEKEYDQAIERLNTLMDEIGTDENHPLYELLDTLGTIVQAYEAENYPLPESSGIEMLRYLMEEHGLTEADLPDIGASETMSKILEGKLELNSGQIRALARRFHVSPAVFI
ncbi:MAG: transcriptional regulator [Chloroflexi bacterium]|nr:transcriptional regulator [Chloroflexota bacterium]